MNFNAFDLYEACRSRLRIIVAIALAIFLLVALVTFLQPRQYLATSSLLVDLAQSDPTDEKALQSATILDSVMGTQVDILKSSLVVDEVARRSGLVQQIGGDAPVEKKLQQVSADLLKRVAIITDRQSNVIQLSYADTNPQEAARIANLYADTFMEKQVELRANPARGNAKWFDGRTAEVRRRLETAQKRLTDFQRQHGIIGVDRMDLEAEKLKSLSIEFAKAEADAAAAHSKAGSADMPEVASALAVQGIEQQVAVQGAHVAELAKTLGPNHPEMRAAQAQLATLRSSLSGARSVQASSLGAASSAASRREGELRSRFNRQQQVMIAMSGVQDQLNVLQRDVESARQNYDLVRLRFNEAALKSEISRANTSILDHASVPLLPAKPNVPVWLLAGLLFGGFIGVGVALALEVFLPRVRSAAGFSQATDVAVIADFSPPTKSWLASLFGSRQQLEGTRA